MTATLKRAVSMPLLVLYGMGNILGAGIYVLVGKVAGESGYATPYAFLLAALVASFTGISYAKLSARYPLSAGEALYAMEAFGSKALSFLVGVAIILAGTVSSSAILHGFVAYLGVFVSLPAWLVIILVLTLLTLIAIWGIQQSIVITALMTLLELFGLLYVLVLAWPDTEVATLVLSKANQELSSLGLVIAGGAFIAFYAYIGFEDMVNIAEEVKAPEKSLPIAVVGALVFTSLIYILVGFVAVARVEPQLLSGSDAPLALIYQAVSGKEPYLISLIALFAVINGALVNMIMCSRVIYGLAHAGMLPNVLAKVNDKTRTPIYATLLVALMILLMVSSFPLVLLAKTTSFVLLNIFLIVNASCFVILRRDARTKPRDLWIPILGMLNCAAMICVPLLD